MSATRGDYATGRLLALARGAQSSDSALDPPRVAALLGHRPLVVADLTGRPAWRAQLLALAAARPPHELLIVVQRPEKPDPELLWAAIGARWRRRRTSPRRPPTSAG
jgi:hypothetical protein